MSLLSQDNSLAEVVPEEDEGDGLPPPEGYIVLKQQLRKNTTSKVNMTREEILIGFATMAVEAGIDALAEDLIGTNGKFGPYEVYTDMKSMDAIREHFKDGKTMIEHKV